MNRFLFSLFCLISFPVLAVDVSVMVGPDGGASSIRMTGTDAKFTWVSPGEFVFQCSEGEILRFDLLDTNNVLSPVTLIGSYTVTNEAKIWVSSQGVAGGAVNGSSGIVFGSGFGFMCIAGVIVYALRHVQKFGQSNPRTDW